MHANQLAELGSWVAINAGTLIYGENEQPMMVATNYWTASKIRINRWITALKMFEQDFNSPIKNHDPWPAMAILIQEILFSEMLTRVWAATVTTHDWYHNSDEMHGLAHSVHISHIEAKNRAIRVMLHGRSTNEKMFDQLNSSRRRMERWTDLFLGQLPSSEQAALFAFDRNRGRDFINENQETAGQEFVTRQKVLMLSFAADMLRDKIDYSANPEINREIAAGILSCFPADRFDSYGLPKSVRSVWLEKSQTDTQMLIDHLFEFDNKSLSKPTPSPPPPYTQVKRNISL